MSDIDKLREALEAYEGDIGPNPSPHTMRLAVIIGAAREHLALLEWHRRQVIRRRRDAFFKGGE